MLRLFGVFILLHGLVHLLECGQSRGLFELRPGMRWPIPSWAFSRFLAERDTRLLAAIICMLVTMGLASGGIGLLIDQSWWNRAVSVSATLWILLFVLWWDGHIDQPRYSLPDLFVDYRLVGFSFND
jgi:hypothetical protein